MSLIFINFPSDFKSENLAITKENIFQRSFESLDMIVNFIIVTTKE